MNDLVEAALGHVAVQIHGDTDERLYGYFGNYGQVPDSMDELNLITDKAPMYPTNNLVEVEVERLNAAYLVTRARQLDTSNPENYAGEWHDLEELDSA